DPLPELPSPDPLPELPSPDPLPELPSSDPLPELPSPDPLPELPSPDPLPEPSVPELPEQDNNGQPEEEYDNPFKRGYIVKFGRCPQNLDASIMPIEWIVIHSENNRALLFSRYGLFDSLFDSSENCWKTSDIYRFLNVNFYGAFFTDEERAFIDNDENAGGRVFLLSEDEVYDLLDDDLKTCPPTEFLNLKRTDCNSATCKWWLRETDRNNPGKSAMIVDEYGALSSADASKMDVAVRPAVWIKF
ncbi:MAG: DUF6273 domain-containing protein, partial [bacterium]|nr:DUF6273 domain-containing protein [bacterium]